MGRTSLVIAAAWLAATSASCTTQIPSDEHYYDNFKTAVANADQQGYTPYWLGREFVAGGLTYKGPDVADFGDEVDGGGVSMGYSARLARGGVSLNMSLYSRDAWSRAEVAGISRVGANASVRTVTVAGHTGTLVVIPSGTPGVRAIQLVLRLGETVVRASVPFTISATPGGASPDPLSDEATFLSVMQQLRPYPQ